MAKQNVTVELFYNGAWNAVPVYVRDPITIVRGKGDEAGGLTPQTLSCTIDNRSEAYNPVNRSSDLHGLIGRNTPVRVLLPGDTRFVGEVSSWQPGRTVEFNPTTGRGDAWVKIEAAGVLRRHTQNADPLASPMRRQLLSLNPTAYWPLEDLSGAASGASAVDGVAAMAPYGYSRFEIPGSGGQPAPAAGLPEFASGSGIPGSLPVPDWSQGGVLVGQLPRPTSGTQSWRVAFAAVFPRDMQASGTTFIGWTVSEGTYPFWEIQADSSGLFVTAQDSAGVAGYGTSTFAVNLFDGRPHFVEVNAQTVSGALDARIYIDGFEYGTVHTIAAADLVFPPGWVASITPNVKEWTSADAGSIEGMPQLGHIAVWQPSAPIFGHMEALRGHAGETAADRLDRLGGEEDLTVSVIGAGGTALGVQRGDVALDDLLGEIERTDGGILFEPRDDLGVVLRSIDSLYNQTPALTLAFTDIAPDLVPLLDDQGVRNDVTAKSTTTGAAARATLDSGRMSTQPSPNGVGRVPGQVDVNPADDGRVVDFAGWALRRGTVDEVRWAAVTVDLVASPAVAAATAAVDIGDRVAVTDLPADLGDPTADLLVVGYTEVIGSHSRRITLVCVPASPFDVAEFGTARFGASGSTLYSDLPATSTVHFEFTFTAANGPWTTTPAAFPMDIRVGDEQIRVSAITGTTSPQSATIVARGVNGIVGNWFAGAEVDVWQPAVLAL
ncbi:hypothetical protein [Micromonospora sp. NPDC050495]|uniref:hypothetical protein n=1 Tax=Micromonospora sp. NPDC050495 TaxID=3154936 RepID=UPI0033D0E1E1